ncbi:MAG: hypothetical protein IPK24_02840 [Kineosporiaceae bacterium]|nr:hypothetical protein [Kineosporiaceae bacterium]
MGIGQLATRLEELEVHEVVGTLAARLAEGVKLLGDLVVVRDDRDRVGRREADRGEQGRDVAGERCGWIEGVIEFVVPDFEGDRHQVPPVVGDLDLSRGHDVIGWHASGPSDLT